MLIGNLFKHWTYRILAPGNFIKEKYAAFKDILEHDKKAHEVMAELEDIYYNQTRVDFKIIEKKYDDLSFSVSTIIENLIKMCPHCYTDLRDFFKKIDSYIRYMLEPPKIDLSSPFTMQINNIASSDYPLVGGKALNLGLIGTELNLPIPQGFVITTKAFYHFLEFNNLRTIIDDELLKLDINSTALLDSVSKKLMEAILSSRIPPELESEMYDVYESQKWTSGENVRLAIRSSAVGEDTRSSFAGQYKTILNVRGDGIGDAYKEVIASKYNPRALYYRVNYGLSDVETPMAVIALEMIDAASSGVMYTIDLENPKSRHLTIHSVWGLGELLVSGETSSDIIRVAKEEKPKIIDKKVAPKAQKMVFTEGKGTEVVPVGDERIETVSLKDESALTLADWGIQLENYYGEPQDVEWCMDQENRLFLLQSRLLRTEEGEVKPVTCTCDSPDSLALVSGGERACGGIGAGKVFRIENDTDLENVPDGSVLVARNASPHYVKIMGKLSAVVTDLGSTAGHFSSVAREFGVPTLVNTGSALAKLSQGREVTVYPDAKTVYDGIVQALLDCPCARRDLISDSPFTRKLRYIINFISPLKLVDPLDTAFEAIGVRSIHDIIRFAHERAVQEMFHLGDKRMRKIRGAKKFLSDIPMYFLVLDVGNGLVKSAADKKAVKIEDIVSRPMKAVFKGLNHPGIRWGSFTHFDWGEYDRIIMSGGIISPESAMFASYAVVSDDYLNLNLRFGYHFVILDSICGNKTENNYILFRFSGGGADLDQRMLRAEFLKGVLLRLGFKVDRKSDLVDGELKEGERQIIEEKLDLVGCLLGATRLMDMYLKDQSMVEGFVEDFMQGRYHFESDVGSIV